MATDWATYTVNGKVPKCDPKTKKPWRDAKSNVYTSPAVVDRAGKEGLFVEAASESTDCAVNIGAVTSNIDRTNNKDGNGWAALAAKLHGPPLPPAHHPSSCHRPHTSVVHPMPMRPPRRPCRERGGRRHHV